MALVDNIHHLLHASKILRLVRLILGQSNAGFLPDSLAFPLPHVDRPVVLISSS